MCTNKKVVTSFNSLTIISQLMRSRKYLTGTIMIVLLKYQVSTYLATNPFSEKNNTSDCTTAEGHVTAKVGVVIDVHI